MARAASVLLLAPLLLAAASAPVQPAAQPIDQTLAQALAEQAAAEARAAGLLQAADRAKSEAGRLHAQQLAAAQALEASEAQITAADLQVRLALARLLTVHAQLAREQQPVSSLLAGLALMAQRPPLLAIADEHSTDELVRVRILLDSTLPVIRRRAGALSAQLAGAAELERQADDARGNLTASRTLLAKRRQQFAELEQQALQLAASTTRQSLSAGDVALASGEQVHSLLRDESSQRSALGLAAQLSNDAAPPRPGGRGAAPMRAPFPYQLPAAAPVVEGLGAINDAGVRSRGVTLQTSRGAPVIAPAAGVVRFSGPFRSHDGVVIIDHGGGWTSLLVGVSSAVPRGATIAAGQPLGRALGPVEVELSRGGTRLSPALIAGSSATLSNHGEGS